MVLSGPPAYPVFPQGGAIFRDDLDDGLTGSFRSREFCLFHQLNPLFDLEHGRIIHAFKGMGRLESQLSVQQGDCQIC